MSTKKRIALIGCGALGQIFAKQLHAVLGDYYTLCGVMANTKEHADLLAHECSCSAYPSLAELLADRPDYVVELAGIEAVKKCGPLILEHGIKLIIASVGALAEGETKICLTQAATTGNSCMYVVNGAIGGLDVMQTMALMGGCTSSIDNAKPAASLNGAPYLCGKAVPEDQNIEVFSGSISDAIRGFPKNVNVAVATALATDQPQTEVMIRSIRAEEYNTHTIHLYNAQAEVTMTFASLPDPANPRSSSIAAWSVLALLKQFVSVIRYF